MPDAVILWDRPLFFENMFKEYGISAAVSVPASLHAPHLPPFKLLVVPTGFTYPEYAAVGNALADEKTQKKIFRFVENGGVFLMFSPLKEIPSCSVCQKPPVMPLDRFGLNASYVQEDILIRRPSPLTGDADSVYCDGWFCGIGSEFAAVEQDDAGRSVHIAADRGDGQIILSSVHEFLSEKYFDSLLQGPKVKL